MAVWDLIIQNPILNFLIILSNVLFHNFGLAIIALTIIIRVLMLPLTLKQLRAARIMSQLGPKVEVLKQKYGKDQVKINQEMTKLYRESGMNPAGCVIPMLIQLPIWIALYQGINKAITSTPQMLVSLHSHLYSWPLIHQTIPLGEKFLWLNLGQPDSYYILPALVGISMWVQQKMTTVTVTNPQQQQQNTLLQWGMPIIWVFMTIQFPSGLALYWFVSNIISIIVQYFVTGWGALKDIVKSKDKSKRRPVPIAPVVKIEKPEVAQVQTEGLTDGKLRNERQDRGTSHRTRSRTTGPRTRRDRGHGRSRR